ncbi:MAG: tryptophan-rich sensory protein [Chitinophagales bacterium]|nr:tryptophan-rich sensory protein [Chitinophagales bacterium]
MVNLVKITVSIALPLIAGCVSGIATAEAIPGWYAGLQKPFFNPPNWLFGPVWTTLYVLMGVSFYLIWTAEHHQLKQKAMLVFGLQLFLNFWWSIIFFYFKRMDIALIEIITLWASILWMILLFKEIKPVAGYMQIPYLCWVSFATTLNASLWWLNR